MKFEDLKPIWREAFIDKSRDVTWDGNGFCEIKDIRISDGWPFSGSARFTRVPDGKRFSIKLRKGRFGWKSGKWTIRPVGGNE